MPEIDTAAAVVELFNDRISAADLDGLAALMTPDHQFVDTAGARISGRPACVEAWRGFFAAFPGYRNTFASLTELDSVVTVVGYSECPGQPSLEGPALWTVHLRGDLVSSWRVWDDNPTTRKRAGNPARVVPGP